MMLWIGSALLLLNAGLLLLLLHRGGSRHPVEPLHLNQRPLERLAAALDSFPHYYFLWLIATRIDYLTPDPMALELMDEGRQRFRERFALLRRIQPDLPAEIAASLDELLTATDLDFEPTADAYQERGGRVSELTKRLQATVGTALDSGRKPTEKPHDPR
jgi:hypothetical protein